METSPARQFEWAMAARAARLARIAGRARERAESTAKKREINVLAAARGMRIPYPELLERP